MNKILIISTIILITFFGGCKNKEYFKPKTQVSDYGLDFENFVDILCEKNNIDVNGFFHIECPKCPHGYWRSGMGYNEVFFGSYIERNPEGTFLCLFYRVGESIKDIPAGTYCGQCGYQVGSDWTIYEIDPNNFYYELSENDVAITNVDQLKFYKCYRRTK